MNKGNQTRPDHVYISMTMRNVTETKAELSSLLVLVEKGEDVIISRAGKPVARIVKIENVAQPRKLGLMKDQIIFSPDYDQADAEIEKLFYGDES